MNKDFAEYEVPVMIRLDFLSSNLNQDVHAVPHILLAVGIVHIRPLIHGVPSPMSCVLLLAILQW
jgi:hypothetical protein